jgi:plasmid stabilization system protein ParE
MAYKIIIEPEALQDLLNIKNYITKQDTLNKANIFISELKNTLSYLR